MRIYRFAALALIVRACSMTASSLLAGTYDGGTGLYDGDHRAGYGRNNSTFEGMAFTGTFDGKGHKVFHFSINGGSNDYLGRLARLAHVRHRPQAEEFTRLISQAVLPALSRAEVFTRP
jgi:hypothetical protein